MPYFRALKADENMVIGHLLSAEGHFKKLEALYGSEFDDFHTAVSRAKMIILARPAIRTREDKT